eukprot:6978063-Pyramimonas_sp.AAC.1
MTKAERPQSASFLEELEPGLAEGLRLLRRRTPKVQRLFPYSLAQYRTLIKTVQARSTLTSGGGRAVLAPGMLRSRPPSGSLSRPSGEWE